MGVDYSNTRLFWGYSTHNEFCDRLAEAATRLPCKGDTDPIQRFIDINPCSDEIPWDECAAIGYRMRDLVAAFDKEDFLTMGGRMLTKALRVSAQLKMPFQVY